MALIAAAGAVGLARRNRDRRFADREHVAVQHGEHRALAALVARCAEAGVKVDLAVLHEHAGVKLRLVALALAQQRAVRVTDVAVELVFAGRGITLR